jgi:glycosyltransferase involved in cell wall biosynthesis
MRICFIVHGATKEGAGRYLLDQVDYLRGVGIGVAVVAPAEGPLCTSLRERGVAVYLIANPWWTTAAARSGVPDYQGAMRAARQIVTIFAKEAIDIAYTQTIVAPSGALAAALAGVPHVWHIHEFAYNPLAIEMAVDKPAMARLLDTTSNSVLFCSQAVAAEWLGGGFIPREKARVVYNWTAPGVDLGKPDLDDEVARDLLADDRVFVVATVGSVLRWKRQLDAVDAVGALIGEGVNAGLLIVGPTWDSDYTAEIREAIRTRGLDRRIRVV